MNAILAALACILTLAPALGADLTLTDETRHRVIELRTYSPLAAPAGAKLPVIIFSHGAGGSRTGYSYFGERFARHGFLVIMPSHPEGKRISELARSPSALHARALDVSFVIDKLEKIDPRADSSRVAVAGHILGAATALVVGGATFPRDDGGRIEYGDTRPKAFIALSPPGPGTVFDARSYLALLRPVLVITGTKDRGLGGEPFSWRLKAFELMKSHGNKYLAVIKNASHMSFSGAKLIGANVAFTEAEVERLCLAFLNAHVLDVQGEAAALHSVPGDDVSKK